MNASQEIVYRSIQLLDGRCDGARTRDMNGFNGRDAEFGKSIAAKPAHSWSPKMWECAWKMIKTYRKTQLASMPLDDVKESEIVAPIVVPKESGEAVDAVINSLVWSNDRRVDTKNGPRIVRSAVPDEKFWALWKSNGGDLKAAGFSVSKYDGTWQVTQWKRLSSEDQAKEEKISEEKAALEEKENSVKQRESNADLGVDVLPHDWVPEGIEIPMAHKLLDFQVPSCKRLVHSIKTFGMGLDASDLGSGKCLGKGTPVLMFDGSIKSVEDIIAGDVIMGDDSTPRHVLSTSVGFGKLYRINPVKGDSWVCNEDHILSLRASFSVNRSNCTYLKNEVINIPLTDYQKHNIFWRGIFKQYRTAIEFTSKEVPFDPYIYGLWLADGGVNLPCFCKQHQGLLDAWDSYFTGLGYRISIQDADRCPNHFVRLEDRKGNELNPFTNFVRSSFINEEKRVLKNYLVNNRESRIRLLSGLLDGDGFLDKGSFDVITKYPGLRDDILFVARSLGFAAYASKKIGRIKSIGFEGLYWRVLISGNFSELKCVRHPNPVRKQEKNVLNTGFNVEYIGDGNYYGLVIDGNRRFVLGDFTVTHNTFVAIAAAHALGLRCAVVCPKGVIPSWHKALAHFGLKALFVTNYEQIKTGKTEWLKWEVVKTYKNRKGEEKTVEKPVWHLPEDVLLCVDEAHRCKNRGTVNQEVMLTAIDQKIKVVGISGTLADSPLNMNWSGRVAGMHQGGKDFFKFLWRNGCSKGRFGIEFNGKKEIMIRINRIVFPKHGTRIRIADIPGYPENQIEARTFDCNGEGPSIQGVYEEMYAELAKVQARQDLSRGARQGHVLALMTYARQRVEILKVPAMADLAEDWIEDGRSVVLFVNFTGTREALCKHLKCDCYIDGTQTAEHRQQCIDRFQSDDARIIVAQIASGGVGVSLHALRIDSHPRASIISPSFSAQDTKQATGRIWRAGATSKSMQVVFFADGTIENQICEKVKEKIKRIDQLQDGDLAPEGTLF